MGNAIRIVVGLGGLVAAAWSAGRSWKARRAGEPASFAPTWVILGATAAIMALTALV